MKFTLRPTFALVAAGVFTLCALLAACANADLPQSLPSNLTKVNFTAVDNSATTLKQFPFLKNYFPKPGDPDADHPLVVSVAALDKGQLKDVTLLMDESPDSCGIECSLNVYVKTKDGYERVLDLLANKPVYIQTCTDNASIVTTERYGVAQWVYKNGKFQDKALTYSSVYKVPGCDLKK